MKVSTCTVSQGTYATFVAGGVETTVRLLNGTRGIARDLLELAEMEELNAENHQRAAVRLRKAAQAVGQYGVEVQS